MTLLLKNLLFTVLIPGTAAVYVPLLIAQGRSFASVWAVALALLAFAVGGAIYAWSREEAEAIRQRVRSFLGRPVGST